MCSRLSIKILLVIKRPEIIHTSINRGWLNKLWCISIRKRNEETLYANMEISPIHIELKKKKQSTEEYV